MEINRDFFVCSVCAPGEDYCNENFKRIIDNRGFVLYSKTQQKGTFFDIKVNDILILKYNNYLIAYGKVKKIEVGRDIGWNHWAYVDDWVFKNENNKEDGIHKYGIGWSTIGGGQMGTVKTVISKFAIEKIKAINKSSNLFLELKQELKSNIEAEIMQEKINILEYKKQIILQGPPGTGKTRLAKLMAEEMTKSSEIINPIEKINLFFNSINTVDSVFLEKRQYHKDLLDRFQQRFPIESLLNITKENYALGTGSNDSFCWWIERGLKPLGYYFPGSARSYLLFWKKSIEDYSKHGFVKAIDDNDEAMGKIAEKLNEAVKDKNYADLSKYFGYSFLLKVLHSYYPSEFFPINSIVCIENALKIFNVDYSNLNPFEKNIKLQEIYLQKKNEYNSDITNIEFMRFLFDQFELKGNMEIDSNKLITKGKYKIVQFHPSFSYEDFVRGISAKTNSENKVAYKVEDRILMEFANEALDNSKSKYVLIIDEINRANLSSVLGELIYALEYRYKHGFDNNGENEVESLYDISEDENESNRILKLPDNLYIIGTMNTADRSAGHIDYAIRRRFAFLNILPEILDQNFQIDKFKEVSKLFVSNHDEYIKDKKTVLIKSDYLSEEFKPEDVWLGHSYFISEDDFDIRMEYEIKPLLYEYVKDGILKQSAEKIINEL
ncbi:AAA family ATPase [Flavobacterium sp. UBA7680]|uniref:AAA family ATPase n=1 Tax=Flavobacterium sp. UBA7680 TaxID=1946559 RepID=UPI0025B7AE86|nr:AAA family ATPase [Flavobacterium sp. UBA7680]